MQTFNSWLWSKDRDGATLIRDIKQDSGARVLKTYEELRDHLDRHGSQTVVNLLDQAYADYQQQKQ